MGIDTGYYVPDEDGMIMKWDDSVGKPVAVPYEANIKIGAKTPESTLTINNDNMEMVKIDFVTGDVTFSDNYDLSKAAEIFWTGMGHASPQSLQTRIDELENEIKKAFGYGGYQSTEEFNEELEQVDAEFEQVENSSDLVWLKGDPHTTLVDTIRNTPAITTHPFEWEGYYYAPNIPEIMSLAQFEKEFTCTFESSQDDYADYERAMKGIGNE